MASPKYTERPSAYDTVLAAPTCVSLSALVILSSPRFQVFCSAQLFFDILLVSWTLSLPFLFSSSLIMLRGFISFSYSRLRVCALYYCVQYVASAINLRCCLNSQHKQKAPRHAGFRVSLLPPHISASSSCFMALMAICTPTLTSVVVGQLMVNLWFMSDCEKALQSSLVAIVSANHGYANFVCIQWRTQDVRGAGVRKIKRAPHVCSRGGTST